MVDVSHGIQCVLEKGLDDFGAAPSAQCDIQQFYDFLTIPMIFHRLLEKSVPAPLVAAAVFITSVCGSLR